MARQENFIDRRAPLSAAQKELMMVVLIRSREAFDAVVGQLKPEHFPPHDKKYAVLWAAVVDYFDENRELPRPAYLTAEIQRRLDDDPEALLPEEVEELDTFIGDFAFNFKKRDLRPQFAISKAKQLMEDSLHSNLAEIMNERDTPVGLGNLLGQMHDRAITISSLDTPSDLPFPECDDDWKPKALSLYSTGVDFLDAYLDGGHAPKEVNLLLGPFGSCKTMLGIQISISTGHNLYRRWVEGGRVGPCPVVYHVSAETPIEELRLRAMSHYASIERSSLFTPDGWDGMSTRGNLKEYEVKLFGSSAPGEQERRALHKRLLNQFWCPIDISGKDKRYAGRGRGGVDEIVSLIRAEQRARGNPHVGVVIVDYAQLIASRYIQANLRGDHNAHMRHVCGRMPGQLTTDVAATFDCPVWLLVQLNKAGNTKNPGILPSHSDAAEASNMAENADFAFVVGNKQEGNVCLVGATKTRRAELQHPIPVWIDGKLNTVRNRSAEMMVDPASKRIVRRGELSRVIGDSGDSSRDRRQRQAGDEVHFLGNM